MNTKLLLAGALALCLAAPVAAPAAAPDLKTEAQKTAYAIGLNIAQGLQVFSLSAEELELVKAGLTDGIKGGAAPVDAIEYRPKIQQLQQERAKLISAAERKDSAAFAEKMAKEKGAEKTASGLVYIPVKAGAGAAPKATDTVKVHYHGTVRDGSVFDSSVDRGEPATFPLNRVIPCWTEGVQKMKVGGKAKLVCPADIAYGDRGAPPKIKPGATLLFEVELLAIEEGSAAPMPSKGNPHSK